SIKTLTKQHSYSLLWLDLIQRSSKEVSKEKLKNKRSEIKVNEEIKAPHNAVSSLEKSENCD
ncbi:unnamed protein product, partial [Sphenostylis stenocarpa]